MLPKPPHVAIFNIGPCLQVLCVRYNMQQPLNSHQYMVVNLWIAKAIERIFSLMVTPHPSIYDYSPLMKDDLTLIDDSTMDTYLTKTIRFNQIHQCMDVGGLQLRTRLSADSLIVEM